MEFIDEQVATLSYDSSYGKPLKMADECLFCVVSTKVDSFERRGHRTSSLFSLKDYENLKEEKQLENKGQFTLTHYDQPHPREAVNTQHGYNHDENNNIRRPRLSFISSHCGSNLSLAYRGKHCGIGKTSQQNSYELEPKKHINEKKIRQVIQQEVANLKDMYTNQSKICLELTSNVKTQLKMLQYSRLRFIVNVTAGENLKQDLRMASGFFWDSKRDTFISEAFEFEKLFVIVSVFAVYFE